MSLKRNIIANYIGQFYAALVGIVMVPIYVQYMGAEAYGLVGFFSMILAWFYLLDMGLTVTLARETARFCGNVEEDAFQLRRLLRSLEGIFIGIAILGASSLIAASGVIASRWLKVQLIPLQEVRHVIMLMAVIIALRWMSGLYRSAITGFERLVWLSGFNIVLATIRFILIVPFLVYVGASPLVYFGYQLVVAIGELAVLAIKTYQILPGTTSKQRLTWQWEPLRAILHLSLPLAFTLTLWVMVTQVDRLLLSRYLSLTDYAYFYLATTVAAAIGTLSNPMTVALLPHLTKRNAMGDEMGLISLYRETTQLVGVITIPAMLILTFFPDQILWAWTGNAEIAHAAAPVLKLYAFANAIQTFGAFPFYLQYAKGDLKLHMLGATLSTTLLIPSLIWAVPHFGAVGAGYARVVTSSLYFIFWVTIVHRRMLKNLHIEWLLKDVGILVIPTVLAAILARWLITWPQSRILTILVGFALGLAFLLLTAAVSSQIREKIRRRFHETVV